MKKSFQRVIATLNLFQGKQSLTIFMLAAIFALSACGSDSSSSPYETSAKDANKPFSGDVSGIAQVGPFVEGSNIVIQGLDSTFIMVFEEFTGEVADNDGAYSIKEVSSETNYGYAKVTGKFYNIVTGSISSSESSLKGVINLKQKNSANINVATSLVYSRIEELVDYGASIYDAKKQAEQELFKTFGFEGNFDELNKLNVYSDTDGGAALLAMTILMLNESETGFDYRLQMFALDFKKDGEWNDLDNRADAADFAVDLDFVQVRKNIQESGGVEKIPDFESYINSFVAAEYKLGECSDNFNKKIVAARNTYSKNDGVYFICDNGMWRKATPLEQNTNGLKCDADGSVLAGAVDTSSFYVCESGAFREASSSEIELKKGCGSYNEGESVTQPVSKFWVLSYTCRDKEWLANGVLQNMDAYEILTDSRDGKKYPITTIGDQTWMAKNLEYDCQPNSAYDDSTYGCYYSWEKAVVDTTNLTEPVRGVCPVGWHIPSVAEFKKLFETVGADSLHSSMLFAPPAWDTEGTINDVGYFRKSGKTDVEVMQANGFKDEYGFSLLPGGGDDFVDRNRNRYKAVLLTSLKDDITDYICTGGNCRPLRRDIFVEFQMGLAKKNSPMKFKSGLGGLTYNLRCLKD